MIAIKNSRPAILVMLVLYVCSSHAADTILYNARIVTVDADFTIAEAVAISDGRILQVGENNEIRALAQETTKLLDMGGKAVSGLVEARVTILVGTDVSAGTTYHGVSVHRELELLVQAGLKPIDALAAATSNVARAYGTDDRGAIAPGKRADLLLVRGDPTQDITATRDIISVWRNGVRFDRTLKEGE